MIQIIHKRDNGNKIIKDEVFINGQFMFLSNYQFHKQRFTNIEQKQIENYIECLKYDKLIKDLSNDKSI
jgi:hypothetical protein